VQTVAEISGITADHESDLGLIVRKLADHRCGEAHSFFESRRRYHGFAALLRVDLFTKSK